MKPLFKELRVKMHSEDLYALRVKAAQAGMSIPEYMRKMAREEKKEDVKRGYRLF